MLARLLAAIFASLCCFSGCSDVRSKATAQINPAEAKELRILAAQIYKELRPKPTAEYLPIKPAKWPERFKKYRPLRAGLYTDGLALALVGDANSEEGLHIVPLTMDLAPARGRITYEKIQDGVYWYQLGK